MSDHGIQHTDMTSSIPNPVFRCYVRLACCCSDYRGLQHVTGMKGSPTPYGCFKCWACGFLTGSSKIIWPLLWPNLPLDHPLRTKEADLIWRHNTSDPEEPRTGKELGERKRTGVEVQQNRAAPDAHPTLVAGEASCYYDGTLLCFDSTPEAS